MAALWQLPPTQPGDDTRLLPPPQHPRPLQQAARLQVLLLHRLGEGLPSDTDGSPGHRQNGNHPPFGLFKYLFMPFGLRNAAQTFQRFMDSLLKHLPFVFCYLDDIIIASNSLEEHIQHLRQIFTILQENGLQINPAKCVFAAAAVEFLGRVDQDGMRPLQRHVQAISDSPRPSGFETITAVSGMVNFYRRFLPGIACTLQPLIDALKGTPKTLEWPPAAAAFGAAKVALGATVPMAHPAPNAVLSLATDASDTHAACYTADQREMAAAGVLLQEVVVGGHQVLHLRQRAAGRFQRGQTFQVLTGGATILPTDRPQAARHIPVPHHAAVAGPHQTSDTHQARRMW
jgi:hypothetical protein